MNEPLLSLISLLLLSPSSPPHPHAHIYINADLFLALTLIILLRNLSGPSHMYMILTCSWP